MLSRQVRYYLCFTFCAQTDNPNTFGASWLQAQEDGQDNAEYADCQTDCGRPVDPICDPNKKSQATEMCNKLLDLEGPFGVSLTFCHF